MNASKEAPTQTTRWDDPLAFRVWLNEPSFEEDQKPWKCLAAFYYLTEALDYIAKCQDAGRDCVHQTPAYCSPVKASDRRVVFKPEPKCTSTESTTP